MNRNELRSTLHVSNRQLSEWIAAGLPRTRTRPGGAFDYDADAVFSWLIETGRAQPSPVVNSIEDVARHFQRTTRRIRGWVQEGMPGGLTGPWDLDAIADWRAERREVTGADPLLAGPSSPALERYRSIRADREALELAVRRGQLVPLEDFLTWYDSEIAAPIRRALEKLRAQFGQPAADLVTEGFTVAADAIEKKEIAPDAQ
jgi:phage terminase Nu1 subunit (DNA packaging protein)